MIMTGTSITARCRAMPPPVLQIEVAGKCIKVCWNVFNKPNNIYLGQVSLCYLQMLSGDTQISSYAC